MWVQFCLERKMSSSQLGLSFALGLALDFALSFGSSGRACSQTRHWGQCWWVCTCFLGWGLVWQNCRRHRWRWRAWWRLGLAAARPRTPWPRWWRICPWCPSKIWPLCSSSGCETCFFTMEDEDGQWGKLLISTADE